MALPTKRRRSTRTEEHTWPLGAFAELVATACAASTQLYVDAHPSPPHITLLDNGPGHPSATLSALTTSSPWRTAATSIGSSLALLTILSDGTATAALLTDPPHILHWPSISPHHPDLPKFLQGTPWSSYDQVSAAFQKLPPSGSLLVISDLKSHPSNPTATQLDFSDPNDIRCPSSANIRLFTSLRAYLQLLFLRPKARIHLRGRIIRERKLASMMWGRTDFVYTPRSVHDTVGTMRFGFDPHAVGDEYGMLIYCRGRLIRPFMRVGPQVPGGEVRVVGIIEADFLTPTRNMQAFERDKLYQGLAFSMDRSLKAFWGKYGNMNKVLQVHSRDVVRKWSRCDDCGHWRIVAVRDGALNPEDISCTRWVCAMNVGGTARCGAPDDADSAVDVGNRRIFGSGKSKAEFSATLKKMRTASPIDATKLATDSQPSSVEATRRRPRVPQQNAYSLAANSGAGGSFRSSPTTTAGVSVGNINVPEMNTAGDSLIREPNLDLDQPTPELVSPELHFNGDGFTLSRNGVASPSGVVPVPASGGLPTTSAGFFASSETSPNVAYGPIDAFLRNVDMKEASLQGGVSLLNKNVGPQEKVTEEIRTSLTSEAEQKISLVSSSFGLGDTPILGETAQAVGGGDTLKSSSSVTHDEIIKTDIVHNSVVDVIDTTNGTNCQVFPNRTAFEPQRTPNGQSEAVMPTITVSPEETLRGDPNTQVTPSSTLMPAPSERGRGVELEPVDAARSTGDEFVNVELASTATPNGLPESEFGVRYDLNRDAQSKGVAAADRSKLHDLGGDIANRCNATDTKEKSTPVAHQGADESQLLSPNSVGTERFGGFRSAQVSKEKENSGSGITPMKSCPDHLERNGGVTTSSAFQVNASNREKDAGPEAGNSINGPDLRSSRQLSLNRESTTENRGGSCMTATHSKGSKQSAGTERKNVSLQRSTLNEVDMTHLLDFDHDDEIGVSTPIRKADAPTQGIPPGVIVESQSNQLPPEQTLNARPREKASLLTGDSAHDKLDRAPQSPACQPMDVGSDGTEPFEKGTPNEAEDKANQQGSDRHVKDIINKGSEDNSKPKTPKDLPHCDTLNSSLRHSPEMAREGTDRSLGMKRRHEDEMNPSESNIEEYRRSGKHHKNAHPRTHTIRRDDSRQGTESDKRRRSGDNPLAVATEAATSAAQAVLGNLETEDSLPTRGRVLSSSAPMELTWSQLALSAAVAAGAAAAAATTARQSHQENRDTANRNQNRAEGKLRTLVSRLLPTADKAKVDDIEALDVDWVAGEIENQIKRDVKEDVVREVSKQLEESQAELKSEKEQLRKLREHIHIFLDKVVGILRTDDTAKPIDGQLENYLQLLDALPSDGPN